MLESLWKLSHLIKCFPLKFLSGKPKVYQGVRVKITVKELLQQRRAKQAASSAAVSQAPLVSVLSLLSSSRFFPAKETLRV